MRIRQQRQKEFFFLENHSIYDEENLRKSFNDINSTYKEHLEALFDFRNSLEKILIEKKYDQKKIKDVIFNHMRSEVIVRKIYEEVTEFVKKENFLNKCSWKC